MPKLNDKSGVFEAEVVPPVVAEPGAVNFNGLKTRRHKLSDFKVHLEVVEYSAVHSVALVVAVAVALQQLAVRSDRYRHIRKTNRRS